MQKSASPDIDQLRAFLAVADAGSLKAAAQLIGRDVAIVSRRLKALEVRLGVRLVERNTRRIALTMAGQAYRQKTEPLLRALAQADDDMMASTDNAPRGRIRITIPTSFGEYWLRPLIVQFLLEYPDVIIDCEVANRQVDLIGERFDVAIRLGVLPDSRLVARRVADRRRLLCAAPSLVARFPLLSHPRDLARVPCLCAVNHHSAYRWALKNADGEEIAVDVTGPLASDDAGSVVEAAVAGLGVANTSEWYVTRQLRAGDLVPVLPDWHPSQDGGVYIVTPTSEKTAAAKVFSDWMAKRLSEAPWSLDRI